MHVESKSENMAMSKGKGGGKQKDKEVPSAEQIVAKFQQMRNEQRAIVSKIAELETDRGEHKLVIATLKDIPAERRCFRMVGGVLMERTVKEVLPIMQNNYTMMDAAIEKLTTQLETKGKAINAYREKHNIRIQGEPADTKQQSQDSVVERPDGGTPGVLVS